MNRRALLRMAAAAAVVPVRGLAQRGDATDAVTFDAAARAYRVRPGGSIQAALEAAAKDPANKIVYVHAGTYRPVAQGQALIWFNGRHDGITLEAVGEVVLTAANPTVADHKAPSFPAVVNHVVYFGDGVTAKTVLRGFRVTGANNYTTGTGKRSPIESDDVPKTPFFYLDGGGIKIYARACPTIERVEVVGNCTSPCGAGVSVEHLGAMPNDAAVFRDCIFRDNRTQVTRCTFTGNWAGVDDNGAGSAYVKSIFWNNTLKGGISIGARYEIDITDGSGVRESFIHGETNDLRGTIDRTMNTFDPPDPRFDAQFVPQAPEYAAVGYRPAPTSRGRTS